MKRTLLLLIPALIAASVFYSCKKDDSGQHNTVITGSYRTLDEAINSTAPKAKSTSVVVASGGLVVAPGGSTFYFPPNAFETLTGGKVTGSVNVTVNDWLRKGDMVFGRVLPITYYKNTPLAVGELSFDKPILSGGEVFVQATQNGEVLRVKKGQIVIIHIPQFGAPSNNFTGWLGRTMAGSANTVNWHEADTNFSRVNAFNFADTIELQTDTLHYLQPGMRMSFNDFRTFKVTLSSPVTLEQSMAVVMYDDNKALFPLSSITGGELKAEGVPSMPMHIAVMGVNQGNFYGGIAAIPSPGNDSTYQVILKAMEPPTLKLQMNAL